MSVSDVKPRRFYYAQAGGLWLVASVFSVLVALSWSKSSIAPTGDYIPMGHDDFYHAARILHYVETREIIQFDS